MYDLHEIGVKLLLQRYSSDLKLVGNTSRSNEEDKQERPLFYLNYCIIPIGKCFWLDPFVFSKIKRHDLNFKKLRKQI
jgi:hypothetical protein